MKVDEHIKEFVQDWIANEDEFDAEEVATQFEGDEMNFNNADTMSGQKCYEYGEILEQVKAIGEEFSKEDDRCPMCLRLLDEEEGYTIVYEDRGEYQGKEAVVTSIYCIHCGHKEDC